MNKTVLVTGANGQLGREVQALSGATAEVRWIFTDVPELDITDATAVRKLVAREGVTAIVNCAAYTAVDAAETDEALADRINHLAVGNLAAAAKESNATLFHISTDYVFGGATAGAPSRLTQEWLGKAGMQAVACHGPNTPLTEQAPTAPLGVYGRTKLAGEQAIAESGCRALILRTAWLYSPHGKNFLQTMLKLGADRDVLRVVFDQAGSPTSATDLARFIVDRIGSDDYHGREGVYHFSNEGVCSWYDFAFEIIRRAGLKADVIPCHSDEYPSAVRRPSYSVLDKTKVKTTFGIRIPHWTEALEACMNKL